jgi:hypothetical protein
VAATCRDPSKKPDEGGKRFMKPIVRGIAVLGCLLCSMFGTGTAVAQKSGGVLKVYHRDSPASMSILEEGTIRPRSR